MWPFCLFNIENYLGTSIFKIKYFEVELNSLQGVNYIMVWDGLSVLKVLAFDELM